MAGPSSRRHQMAQITQGLLQLARGYRRVVDDRLAEHRISDARALPVLYIARAGDGLRQGELADLMGIEGPSLVRLLDQLCEAGLVQRRPDPVDGRAKTLHITDSGRVLARVVEGVLHGLRNQLFAEVSDADVETTLRTMRALGSAVRSAPTSAPAKWSGD